MKCDKYTNIASGHSTWFRAIPTITLIISFLFSILVFLAGCAAPFSDLQSAKLVGKSKAEATPSFSSAHYSDDANTGTRHVQNHYGIQAAYGMSSKVDFRLRFEHIILEKEGEDPFNVIGFGPKIAIVEDVAALNLPFGFALRDEIDISETWEFHPTLIFTPLSANQFEINTSAKALIPLNRKNSDVLIAFNLGAGLSTDIEKWAIRPELEILLNPGEDGHFMHFSIGLAIYP
ncbi:hypothetical protein ACFL6S_07555 [Candidatus Poribacteria bacterium]